ncbi:hypothetical protein LCGC14_2288150 [marine sediment metagenome]|uniref:Uncharacterized protein n=1 Tax=marine sediment metagenome TaxID=412755 RepID=A0A0F9DEL2_9ZZZZ
MSKFQWPFVRRSKLETILAEIDDWRKSYEHRLDKSERKQYLSGLNFATRYFRMKLWGNPRP